MAARTTFRISRLSRLRTMVLGATGSCFALFYLAAGDQIPALLAQTIKPVPVLCLALLLMLPPARTVQAWLFVIGLVLGAVGDWFLALPERHFLAGLTAFLLGHTAYTAAFLCDDRSLRAGRGLLAGGFGACMVVYLVVAGKTGELGIPVGFYIAVICMMLWRSSARVGARQVNPVSAWAGLVGALLFTLSDTLLAINLFAAPIPHAGLFIMATYWAGQCGIAASGLWAGEKGDRPSE